MNCFYEKGLRFTCQPGCHYCCGVEPGFVFVSLSDLKRLASFLALSTQEVVSSYCRKVPMGSISYISLLEKANHDCIFLEAKGCSVYTARPLQCATYPFWAPILSNQEAWENEKQWCPGIDKGEIHPKAEIELALKRRLGVEPAVWEEVVQ